MSTKTVREALNEAMREEMARDDKVIIMGCDVGVKGNPFGVTMGLGKEFGFDRVIDTPISEPSFTGMGVGAAATGMRPIVEIMFCDWITLAMDQIVNSAAKMRYMFGGKVNMNSAPHMRRSLFYKINTAAAPKNPQIALQRYNFMI